MHQPLGASPASFSAVLLHLESGSSPSSGEDARSEVPEGSNLIIMETKAVIVSGEAPESDDESISIKTGIAFPSLLATSTCGTMVQGEARESDDEANSVSSASYVLDPTSCSYTEVKGPRTEKSCVKYNSLLHKKLRECNKSFDRDIRELIGSTISNAVEELNNTNKQLVKSELVLQETVTKVTTSAIQFEEALSSLFRIVDEEYFTTVKLESI